MRHPSYSLPLAVLGLLLLLTGPRAHAVDARRIGDEERVRTVQDDLNDLFSGSRPRRLFAARSFRKQIAQALRTSLHSGNIEREAEALLYLEDMDRKVAPQCIMGLEDADLKVPCARILGLLETREALRPLQAALTTTEDKAAQRAMAKAVERIEAAIAEDPEDQGS